MSITLLYGCCHIELSVPKLAEARQLMERALGAASIEQQLASDLRKLVPDDYGIDHLDCGAATFQLNQPAPSMAERGHVSVHQRYLDGAGPCVTNLNFYVDDIAHARELLGGLGADTLMQGPSTIVPTFADYGAENTRPNGDQRPFLYMGTRHLIGFDLEMMEPNFLHFTDQRAQLPCFFGERPGLNGSDLRLERLSVVVNDLDATYTNLVEIFTPGSRSNACAIREGSYARAFRTTLGGIELEYAQPLGAKGALAEHLERHGPGVVNAEFAVSTMATMLERVCRETPLEVIEAIDLIGETRAQQRRQIASRELVGFDVVLEEVDEHGLVGAH